MGSEFQKLCIIADKNHCHRIRQGLSQNGNDYPGCPNDKEALSQDTAHLHVILRSVVIAYDRGDSHRISYKECHEQEIHIHYDSICRHTVFSRNRNELEVVQNADEGHGYAGNEFAYSVGCCSHQWLKSSIRFTEPKCSSV